MSVMNAYDKYDGVLTPDEMEQGLTALHDLAKAIERSSGHAKTMFAGNYYRLHSKIVDSYRNMWKKADT